MNADQLVRFIAGFITEDPCVFNEEQAPMPDKAPSNAEINAANRDITGLQGKAELELKDNAKADREKKAKEEKLRYEKLKPLFDQADEELESAVGQVNRAYGNSIGQQENLKDSQDNLDGLRDMIDLIGNVAAKS